MLELSSLLVLPGNLPQQDERQTVVVAIGLVKKEATSLPEEQARLLRGGELICLSQEGQVVQECKEEIVEQVELCLVGDTIVGVGSYPETMAVMAVGTAGGERTV